MFCVSSHGAVVLSAEYDSGHIHLLLGCDKSYIRHEARFYSVMPDHKEASTRVK